ncbi:MAG TPA: hypothetical protein VNY84_07690 [Acidimicrobiales bacterium]|jgi:hypothetical protein|nr:hypothetical protein [Acidimicrobiales bacterium]
MDWDDLVICPTCFCLRGPVGDGRLQRCTCERVDDRWPGYDFNQAWELCHCCGAEVLKSGSRWSLWFCEECNARVLAFNEVAGPRVIPIGRHTMMNGESGDVRGLDDDAAIEAFARCLSEAMVAIASSADGGAVATRWNVDALGLARGDSIPLLRYLDHLRRAGVDREAAFNRLRKRSEELR